MPPPEDIEDTSGRLAELEAAIRAAREAGADVSEAEALRQEAKELLWNGHARRATERIDQALVLVEYVHRHRVGDLLSEARRVVGQMEEEGVPSEEARHHISMADEAFEVFDLDLALFELNVAIQRIGEASRLRSEAACALDRNGWLIENLARFGTVPREDADAFRVQGDLLAQAEHQLSVTIGRELEGRLEGHLERHMAVLLERSKDIVKGSRPALGREGVADAREALHEARRLWKQGDLHSALGLVRGVEALRGKGVVPQ